MSGTAQISRVLFKTLLFTIFVPGVVAIWIPRMLRGRRILLDIHLDGEMLARMILAAFLFLMGVVTYLWCAWDFAVKGLGTPAPIDAPKRLVISGPYKHVRNPMYLGVACTILAQILNWWSTAIFVYLILFLFSANLFVAFYEEPHLRGLFGEQYEDYSRNVRRWIPRLAAYRPPTAT
jgi:protein-S-isoprenylcysteine O-methyltransferase Ste14